MIWHVKSAHRGTGDQSMTAQEIEMNRGRGCSRCIEQLHHSAAVQQIIGAAEKLASCPQSPRNALPGIAGAHSAAADADALHRGSSAQT